MNMILAVAAGGAIGATGRFLVGRMMFTLMGPGFPYGTLAVNIIGSFMIGLLIEALALKFNASHTMQGFLVIGILGGFTTFSAFSMEVGLMMERGELGTAAIYAFGSVLLGLGALFSGLYIGRTFF
ncbi:fluoride efflux transporter CrcB [Pseudemcibacter aquimaris]|uniref:fluoride efflux transporter CrcB n=1 Tax=Pseudemcibacter aquimaris TaxID=2857064 RepID=UPI002010F01F|nr:fluoride efflux transporter CrcB [Pseudemcibacter aquimaris]MCC3860455.1 fluoride efflux transporter CrcB [Pseudemcibacter aquimaris]WDU59280.1 fluoride efflux transporter CrcB [Pseudemcibacter aquimaris]